jgi:purine-binding chemotaxis protein CheW
VLTERGTVQLVTFLLDDQHYALRLDAVERVIPAVALTPLPGAPEIVLGLIDVGGDIIPVVDIRGRFLLPRREMGVNDCIIIARTTRQTLGILVDAPDEVIERAETGVDRGDGILMGSEYIEGVLRLEGGLVLIHDLERFLSVEEEKSLDGALAEKGDSE